MKHGSLFNGIGGFQLAASWMGWENIFSCEIDDFCNKVTKHHFKDCIQHGDIKLTDFNVYRGRCDILTGGFPCQPYSIAGKRKGKDDDRHLWPEMLRAIREIQPGYVVGENVRGLTNWNEGLVFDQVQADLEAEGYEVLPFLLPACAVNAPHRRDRIWLIAKNTNCNGWDGKQRKNESGQREQRVSGAGDNERLSTDNGEIKLPGTLDKEGKRNKQPVLGSGAEGGQGTELHSSDSTTPNAESIGYEQTGNTRNGRSGFKNSDSNGITTDPNSGERCKGGMYKAKQETAERHAGSFDTRPDGRTWENFPTQSPVCGGDDGIPRKLDGITFSKWRNESIKGLGNAIVPQVAYQIFKAIEQYEQITPGLKTI